MVHQPRIRVVIADDYEPVRAAFERVLQSSCDVVATVSTGTAAVEAIRDLRPDLAIVDLMMPDITGLDVCRRVKRSGSATHIIIVTAYDDAVVHTAALEAGASAFVAKHSAASELIAAVQHIFGMTVEGPRERDAGAP